MKKVVSLGLALSLALGGVLPTFSSEPTKVEAAGYEFTKEQQEALNYINDIRKKIGLKPVTLNPFLIKAAENHAKYLQLNNITFIEGVSNHDEISGKKGYTGKTVIDRVKVVGGSELLYSRAGELISYNKKSMISAINNLLDAPFHRASLVDPQLMSIGISLVGSNVVIVTSDFEDWTNNEESIYPYDGQTNVEIEFIGKTENPNPLKEFNLEKSGYVVSFVPSSDYVIGNISGKIVDSKGKEVPAFFKEDWNTYIFFLFPKAPLLKNEKYTVTFTYTDEMEGITRTKTWSFTTGSGTSTPTTPPKQTPSKPKVVYADYKDGQYWSEAMLWAIDKGYITGYMNVKNQKTGKVENLLKPMDTLTEGQFLTILFRYLYPDELKNTKPKDPKFDLSVVYQMAEKYKLPTKANFKNRADAYKPISRGTMAQILASAHYKKVVTEKDAVKFMYDAKITSGYPDKNGKYPKTYESFGVKENLLRAHIAVFLKNYDTYLQNNKKQVVNGNTVDYGEHTYASKNQAEYNKVMEIVRNELKRVEAPEMQVLSATATSSVKSSTVKNSVIINGIKQNFKQGVVIQNKVAHIPVKETLEKLGAKVTYNSKTKQLTVVKDKTTVVLTIGKDTALVNKKASKIGGKVFVYKGVTVVPAGVLNFFNCKVSVDMKNANVSIAYATSSAKSNSSSSKSGSSTATQTQNKKQVVKGITVDYGRHTYGVKNQAEYNKVMEIVRNALKRLDKEPWTDGRLAKYRDMYLNGDRKENYKVGSLEYIGLLQAENSLGDLVRKGVSKEEIKKVYKLGMIASDLLQGAKDPRNGKPSSAYDALVNKLSDCDSGAQVYSAVYDAMGYNTMILAGNNHASAYVQIGDNWYGLPSLRLVDMTEPLDKDGYVLVQPTNGDIYNKDGTFTKAKN
ncbi:stalk domain-containing protein [Geobacillus subterraneus]|uniref:SLH domain-containing protein n=1 Tax=Geobacillus subterraneus TaxID=129338 RepID=A0A679FYE8_9BACL|nr:stalk domain-containing protein [Geobacillus subterraneus]BBW98756.1 hypothetical protein GsuE55_35890 [Geobacillus subterraneus]